MISNNFMITLVSIVAVLFALFNINPKKENFNTKYGDYLNKKYGETNDMIVQTAKIGNAFGPWASPMGLQGKVTGVTNENDRSGAACAFNKFDKSCKGITAPRSMQPLLSPRGGGLVNQSKLSRAYSNTADANLALQAGKPMNSACKGNMCNMVKGDYGVGVASPVKENFEQTYVDNVEMLPVADMCDINVFGSESQPIIYDRLMFSNIRSRLRGNGDYIRGDLPIVPDNYKAPGADSGKHDNWFQVSVKPERDLNPGAMRYISRELEDLSIMHGSPVGSIRDTTLSAAQGDVEIATYGN